MASSSRLPSGTAIFSTVPDCFFIPEFVFGGLVWTLVASTFEYPMPTRPLGWVMFVSIICFVFTALWFLAFIRGKKQSSGWLTLDVAGHALAALLYLSSLVILANITVDLGQVNAMLNPFAGRNALGGTNTMFNPLEGIYKRYVAAVVFSFLATLFYVIHAVCSANRWKSP